MNPRVADVIPSNDYTLRLLFTNGERRIYDCSALLKFGVFRELQDRNYFSHARVVDGTVAWPHDQDICPDTLYLDSRPDDAQQSLPADGPLAACADRG